MSVAEHIARRGFRGWYERQLIEAHAWLVTALLAAIVIMVCLDQFRWRDAGVKPMILLALIVVGGMLCAKMLAHYIRTLFFAERLAAQSTCAQCRTYGALQVLNASPSVTQSDDSGTLNWLKVRCKRCSHEWIMNGSEAVEQRKGLL